MQVQTSRTRYETCPLCNSSSFEEILEADCKKHPLFGPEIPESIQWVGCTSCGHTFTDGYFEGDVFRSLMARANAHQTASADVETARHFSAAMVEKVANVLGALDGRWLDVGFGSGSLLATAAEFGFDAVGIDAREQSVADLRELGYDARCSDFCDLEDELGFDVISMADVLEHIPFPSLALEHARSLMPRGGALFISMPNTDCLAWKSLDQRGENPYWSELEHFHNFSREHLYWLLAKHGFQPCHYGVSRRYRAAMEVIATC